MGKSTGEIGQQHHECGNEQKSVLELHLKLPRPGESRNHFALYPASPWFFV
jgi:hypothetical protein